MVFCCQGFGLTPRPTLFYSIVHRRVPLDLEHEKSYSMSHVLCKLHASLQLHLPCVCYVMSVAKFLISLAF